MNVLKKPSMAGVPTKPSGKSAKGNQASTGVAGKAKAHEKAAKKPSSSDATVLGAESSNTGKKPSKASTGYQRIMEMSKEFQQKREASKDSVFFSMP